MCTYIYVSLMIGKSAIHVAKKKNKKNLRLSYHIQSSLWEEKQKPPFVVSGRDTRQESILHPRTQKTKRWGSVSALDKVQKL